MIRLGTTARNNITNGVVDAIDDTTGPDPTPNLGIIEIYEGVRPAQVYEATGETLLATLTFQAPAFDSSGTAGGNPAGQAVANPISPETSAPATGTAAWFKILSRATNGNGNNSDDRRPVLDGLITTIGGGGDIEFDDVSFTAGGTILINSILVTTPEECETPSASGSLSASVWLGGP